MGIFDPEEDFLLSLCSAALSVLLFSCSLAFPDSFRFMMQIPGYCSCGVLCYVAPSLSMREMFDMSCQIGPGPAKTCYTVKSSSALQPVVGNPERYFSLRQGRNIVPSQVFSIQNNQPSQWKLGTPEPNHLPIVLGTDLFRHTHLSGLREYEFL